MGIQGLLPLLKPVTECVSISSYKYKTVAVDAYSWIHKATYGCSTELCTKQNDCLSWITYCLNYIDLLLSFNIFIYLVFDGGNLPAKLVTEDERRKSRKKNLDDGFTCLKKGDSNGARLHFSRAVDVTPLMAAQLIQYCRQNRPTVKCIVAPYEADAQLSFLSYHNIVDAVISEDSDLVCYGCKEVSRSNNILHCYGVLINLFLMVHINLFFKYRYYLN